MDANLLCMIRVFGAFQLFMRSCVARAYCVLPSFADVALLALFARDAMYDSGYVPADAIDTLDNQSQNLGGRRLGAG